MGREIRRVPVDFDWPLDKRWHGFLVPEGLHGEPCRDCNVGETWASRWLYILCSQIGMLATDVRDQEAGRPMHPWLAGNPYPAYIPGPDLHTAGTIPRVSADILDLFVGITGRPAAEIGGLFGRTIEYDIYQAIGKAAGGEEWGQCPTCAGQGEHEKYPGQRAEREAWEPTDPPVGEGWQLWETVSEGSPISPVFPAKEGLVDWLCSPAYTWGASSPMTREQAEQFVDAGWAPSGFSSPATGFIPGEQMYAVTS